MLNRSKLNQDTKETQGLTALTRLMKMLPQPPAIYIPIPNKLTIWTPPSSMQQKKSRQAHLIGLRQGLFSNNTEDVIFGKGRGMWQKSHRKFDGQIWRLLIHPGRGFSGIQKS